MKIVSGTSIIAGHMKRIGDATELCSGPARRVLFVQTQAENAGAQEISRLIGDGLASRGHHVRHLFFYRASRSFADKSDTIVISSKRPSGPFEFARFLWRLVRSIRAEKPDVVFCFQHYGNVLAAPAARFAGVRRVVANHVSARETINRPVRLLDKLLGSIGIYDAITVNSQDLMADYHNYPARYSHLICMIPHGFKSKIVDCTKIVAREFWGLPVNVTIIGSVCRLHPLKQLDRAIRLLPDRPQLHFAVAGQGPDETRLRALAKDLGVADRVHLIGELESDDVGRFLAALEIFVFPTAAETFGLAAVEAAQAGLPVVASNLAVLQEVLCIEGEPCARFVETGDSVQFGEAIDGLLENPDEAHSLSSRGKRLGERYSLDGMIEAYVDLME